MGRRKLVLDNLNLGQSTEDETADRAEEVANRILDTFGLEVSDPQFDTVCEVLDHVALNRQGEIKDHRSISAVCKAISDADLPDMVRVALLLVLLKDPIRDVRGRLVLER